MRTSLSHFVIAYLVADNNVKHVTFAVILDHRQFTPDLWLLNSPDLNPVDYRI